MTAPAKPRKAAAAADPAPGTPEYEARKRRELGVRVPEKKEARQFVSSIQLLMGAAHAPNASTGDQMEEVVSDWIVRLTDLTAEEVDDMDPHTHQLYGGLFIDMGMRLAARPSKKR